MANIYEHGGMGGRLLLTGLVDGNYVLGDGSSEVVSMLVLHVVVASGTVSIVPKVRSSHASARRNVDDIVFQPIPYVRRNVGGTVSDDTAVSDAIAATGIFKVDISGFQASLEIDQTDGAGVVYWSIVAGAGA